MPPGRGLPKVDLLKNIDIKKTLVNKSPILFQNPELIQSSLILSESISGDTDSAVKKIERSYINVSSSHMDTYGGQVSFIELSYKESRNKST